MFAIKLVTTHLLTLHEKIIEIFLILARLTAGAEKLSKIEFETMSFSDKR